MGDALAPTLREQRKAERRRQLLDAAGRLIAERGFHGVRLDDLGAAAGISGPAVYRHFPSKEALLVELLTGISDRLYADATDIVAAAPTEKALEQLVDLHLEFALANADLIRIQDRELENLPPDAHRRIRKAQRQYVETWVAVLRRRDPARTEAHARIAAHAAFGLINSTPHSSNPTSLALTRNTLRTMALAALQA